jgi:ATP-dependent Clp protease adaptor protein ClpS
MKIMSTKEKIQEESLVDTLEQPLNEIVVYNDDVNTFDHVIDTLIYACDHTPEQAEQCSIIVHYKGKCTVKTGSYDDLEPRCSMLLEAGLSAEIV